MRRICISLVGALALTLVPADIGVLAEDSATPSSSRVCSGLSDAYAREFVIANVQNGRAIAAHMIDRSCVDQTLFDRTTGLPMYNVTSSVWGGYVDTVTYPGSVVTQTESYNTYQRASDSYGTMSSWVGIGGVHGSGYLAQDGAYNTSPAVTWYETFPNPAHATGVYPSAGNQMLYLVQFDYSNGKYYFLEDDTSTNKYASQEVSFTPDVTTAEWITESYPGPVPACNPITFSTANWKDQFGQWWILNSHASTAAYYLNPPYGGAVTPSGISGSNTFTNSMTP
jgi:hypothetical protein